MPKQQTMLLMRFSTRWTKLIYLIIFKLESMMFQVSSNSISKTTSTLTLMSMIKIILIVSYVLHSDGKSLIPLTMTMRLSCDGSLLSTCLRHLWIRLNMKQRVITNSICNNSMRQDFLRWCLWRPKCYLCSNMKQRNLTDCGTSFSHQWARVFFKTTRMPLLCWLCGLLLMLWLHPQLGVTSLT